MLPKQDVLSADDRKVLASLSNNQKLCECKYQPQPQCQSGLPNAKCHSDCHDDEVWQMQTRPSLNWFSIKGSETFGNICDSDKYVYFSGEPGDLGESGESGDSGESGESVQGYQMPRLPSFCWWDIFCYKNFWCWDFPELEGKRHHLSLMGWWDCAENEWFHCVPHQRDSSEYSIHCEKIPISQENYTTDASECD